jgi:uncharacterized membrane protein YccC
VSGLLKGRNKIDFYFLFTHDPTLGTSGLLRLADNFSYFCVTDGFAMSIIHGKRPWVKLPRVFRTFLVVCIVVIVELVDLFVMSMFVDNSIFY